MSFVMAIAYMILSCCCWVFGVRQFYHLIRIAQLLYMINLMSVNNRPADVHAVLENFKYNIFNIVPNPVKINERTQVECIPTFDFWAEGYSCHAYNTLKNYVLGFLIYLVIYGFLRTNKYQDVAFWQYLKRNVNFTVFMISIMPDVFLAILVNAVAPLTNSVLSLGFLFSLILILWYGYLISDYLRLWSSRSDE